MSCSQYLVSLVVLITAWHAIYFFIHIIFFLQPKCKLLEGNIFVFSSTYPHQLGMCLVYRNCSINIYKRRPNEKKNTSLFSKKEGTKILYLTDSILEYRYMSCIPFWILLPTVWPILQSLISHLSQYDRSFLFHSSFVNHPSTLPIHIYRPMCFTSLQKTEPK